MCNSICAQFIISNIWLQRDIISPILYIKHPIAKTIRRITCFKLTLNHLETINLKINVPEVHWAHHNLYRSLQATLSVDFGTADDDSFSSSGSCFLPESCPHYVSAASQNCYWHVRKSEQKRSQVLIVMLFSLRSVQQRTKQKKSKNMWSLSLYGAGSSAGKLFFQLFDHSNLAIQIIFCFSALDSNERNNGWIILKNHSTVWLTLFNEILTDRAIIDYYGHRGGGWLKMCCLSCLILVLNTVVSWFGPIR